MSTADLLRRTTQGYVNLFLTRFEESKEVLTFLSYEKHLILWFYKTFIVKNKVRKNIQIWKELKAGWKYLTQTTDPKYVKNPQGAILKIQ